MAKVKATKKTKGRLTPTVKQLANNNNVVTVTPATRKKLFKKTKRVSWKDERIHELSVGEIDPAIIVVREKKFVYTRDELFEIGKNAASKVKPAFLDPAEVPNSMLDPEKWNLERRKSDTPMENGAKSIEGPENRRRSGDPRERIRKENDGIVLSPQRRSFNTGCFVPANREPAGNGTRPGGRAHSPLGGGKGEPGHMGGREIPTGGGRRVGSGRILRVSCDMDKGEGGGDGDYFNRGGPLGGPMRGGLDRGDGREDKREDKYGERRTFGRDFENRDNIKDNGRRNNRYTERRRYTENREEIEPEWFSSGPISQNDTIELRGFDESEKPSKKVAPSRMKRAKEWARKKTESQSSITEEKEGGKEETAEDSSSDAKSNSNKNQEKKSNNNEEKVSSDEAKPKPHNDHSIHFEDILKCDNIPDIFANGIDGAADNSTSRFSRWFRTSPQEKAQDSSRRSSVQEENIMFKDLLNDINEQSSIPISIQPPPGDSDSYFAPISPAGNTVGGAKQQPPGGQKVNIMDMFQRGKQTGREYGNLGAKPGPGKILSLDELEAKIRPESSMQQTKPQKPDEGMTEAFKRLLAQAGGQSTTQNGPMHKPQAMSLMEMLSHSQQQDEARLAAASVISQRPLMGGNVAAVAQAAAAAAAMQQQQQHNDLTLKLQQAQIQKQQMDMLNKLINAPPQIRASPLLGMDVQQSRELLNRPEAQAILQGLKRGEITTQNLYQQLANPALQPRHRDMLLTIIKLHNAGSALQQAGNNLHSVGNNSHSATANNPSLHTSSGSNLLSTTGNIHSSAGNFNMATPGNNNLLNATATSIMSGTTNILNNNLLSASNSNPASGGASYGPSPRILSPVPPGMGQQHALYQQQQQLHQQQLQQQLRVSPLPPNAYCVSPIMATSPNTLALPAMHQRIPSPRELQVHTQNILQRALIKKKLEEQTENYRKKQEMQRGASPNPTTSGTNQTPKSVSSPTPLAFTPTSVLRKMTADKDEGKENKADNAGKQMGRPVTGMRPQAQPVVPSQNWNQQFPNAMSKQVGRPIVKNNYQPPQTADQFFSQVQAAQQNQQQQQQRLFAAQQQQMLVQQQHQQRKQQQQQQPMNAGQQFAQHTSVVPNQYANTSQQYHQSGNTFSQQLTQQQLRAQHQHRPANQTANPTPAAGASQPTQRETSTSQQQAGSSGNNASGWQQNKSETQTANQLARWFSPDLLERARGGELPSTANLARHAMSLEEIERQSAPPVHN